MCFFKASTMNPKDIHTYTSAKLMYNKRKYPKPIACTLDQVRDMCRYMEEKLPGTKLQVEAIGGGGIEFMNTDYKSIRFNARDFPWIHDANLTKGSFHLTNKNSKRMSVFLKAFYGATAFTLEELVMFKAALKHVVLDPLSASEEGLQGWTFYNNLSMCKDLPRFASSLDSGSHSGHF